VNLSTDKVANKLQCYLVVNPIKKFWDLVHVEWRYETLTVYTQAW